MTGRREMAGTGEQGTGMSTGITVRTLRGRQQFPSSARFFPLFPRQVTAEQVERIDLKRVSPGTGLKIGVSRFREDCFAE